MSPVLIAFIFAFGAIIGSFLNAVIFRLWTKESIAGGRSHCMACRHTLGPLDLVPIVSWLLLRGKCRYCEAAISRQYLAVEAVTGAAFVLAANATLGVESAGDAVQLSTLLLYWAAASVLIIVFVYDLKYMLILRSVTFPAAIIAALANLWLGMSWMSILGGVATGGGFFLLQRAVSRGTWVGGGDVNLGWFMGALLGWPMVAVALFMSYVMGAVVGVGLLAGKKAGMRTEVPFGTFLSVGTFVTLLWGKDILGWYLGLL
jgi:leader peptidase (prepilin peptidase)/N-methyltransferase